MGKELATSAVIPSFDEARALVEEGLGEKRMKMGELMGYSDLFERLNLQPDGVHDIFHAARALVVGGNLARWERLDGEKIKIPEIEVCLMAHDCERRNDGYDWFHGARAAQRVRRLLAGEILHVDLGLVEQMCAWHVLPDELTPRKIREEREMEIVEDADALDRHMTRGRLNTRLLRLPYSLQIVNLAREFHIKVENRKQEKLAPLQIVAEEALAIGLLIK